MVITTAPGEEAQVDYGEGPMVRDPHDRQVPAHAALRADARLLAASAVRLLVVAVERADLGRAARAGVSPPRRHRPQVVVLDNLREGVLTPDVYDPTLNPLYRDVLAHYGVVALPCRVRDPDRKGKVESGVGHAQRTPLQGLRFETLEEAQAYLDRWEARWADTRIHGTTKRQVAAMFAEEQPAPAAAAASSRFATTSYGERTVHLDGCVEVDARVLRARRPAGSAAESRVQWDDLHVRLLDPKTGAAAARAPRAASAAGIASHDDDRPARTPPTHARAARARRHGAARTSARVCDAIHQHDGELGVRRILGVLALAQEARRRGRRRRARRPRSSSASPTYRFVRRYLERRPPVPLDAAPGRPAHPRSSPTTATSSIATDRRPAMNLVELDRALRKLRLSGMADVLETRLRQAQTEQPRAHRLSSPRSSATSSLRRQDRLLERRIKQAGFRDAGPNRSTASISTSTRR